MNSSSLKGDFLDDLEFCLNDLNNQIYIAVHWLRVEREAETPASAPTVLDEGSCSHVLGILKQSLELGQLCVCSWEDVYYQVAAEARAASETG